MFKDPNDCKAYGRTCHGPDRARIFEIAHLVAMWEASRRNPDGPTLRAWTYVLLSCALFLRKAEAAYLKIQDIEIPVDKATGDPLMSDGGIPRYVFIHIRRSKTDQAAAGVCLLQEYIHVSTETSMGLSLIRRFSFLRFIRLDHAELGEVLVYLQWAKPVRVTV